MANFNIKKLHTMNTPYLLKLIHFSYDQSTSGINILLVDTEDEFPNPKISKIIKKKVFFKLLFLYL